MERCIVVLPAAPCTKYCAELSSSFVRPSFNFTMSRQTPFQTKHELDYRLKKKSNARHLVVSRPLSFSSACSSVGKREKELE
jgi:hypothetical protein